MARHLADRRAPSDGGRLKQFLRIARGEGDRFWQALWRSPRPAPATARRIVEYVRIDRGRET